MANPFQIPPEGWNDDRVTVFGNGDMETSCSICDEPILFREGDQVHVQVDDLDEIVGILCARCSRE